MSDLDKLMKKLKTDEPKAEVPKAEVPTPAPLPVTQVGKMPTPAPVPDTDDDTDDEGVELTPAPASDQPDEHSIEAEVGLLQNNGIFRRELILVLKELVDVHKVNTQTLLDIKSKLMGEDGKKD